MNNERDKVLAMLQEGTIDAEQANELLEAMEPKEGKMVVTAVFGSGAR